MEKQKINLRVSSLTAFDPSFQYVDFIEEVKTQALAIIWEDLLEKLRTEGVTIEQTLRGLSKYLDKHEYPDDIIDDIENLACKIYNLEKDCKVTLSRFSKQ